jgi:hypothetical protein
MKNSKSLALLIGAACLVAPQVPLHAGQQGQGQLPSSLPLSLSLRERGSSVTPAFEGWYKTQDGGIALLVGYFNRNSKQEFDIPVGPNNRIEPGGPDMGQPTHFTPGRQWGIFSIKLPKDFGDKKLTWTIVANGFSNTITLHTKPDYILEPFEDAASGNTPPSLRFAADGPQFQGPPLAIAATYTTSVGEMLTLTTWATDAPPKMDAAATFGAPAATGRGPAVPPAPMLKWSMFRGPGVVTFDPFNPKVDRDKGGENTTKATFSAPGEYILRLQANDSTGEGGGGFQCCWTNTHVRVTVRTTSIEQLSH